MSRASRIEEAARRVVDDVDTKARWTGEHSDHWRALSDLRAALAAPEDGGGVVERAASVLFNCRKNTPDWQARALSRAGLLARTVDRERLARALAKEAYHGEDLWEGLHERHQEQFIERADRILREVGR